MIEFIIVIPVLILLTFGTVQIGLIDSAKTTLNYTAFQSARLAAFNNATYSSLRHRLIRGIVSLYTSNVSLTTVNTDIDAGINSGNTKHNAQSEVNDTINITKTSPTRKQFEASRF